MNKPAELKVDPKVAFTKTIFVPNTSKIQDAAEYAVNETIAQARAAGRRPMMVEVTIRVAA